METHELCYYLQKKAEELRKEMDSTQNEHTHCRLTGKYAMLMEIADDFKLNITP